MSLFELFKRVVRLFTRFFFFHCEQEDRWNDIL